MCIELIINVFSDRQINIINRIVDTRVDLKMKNEKFH